MNEQKMIEIMATGMLTAYKVALEHLGRQVNAYHEALQDIASSPPFSNRLDEIRENDPDYRRGFCVYCGTTEDRDHNSSCEWRRAVDALAAFDEEQAE
jgi:hypothetical protein